MVVLDRVIVVQSLPDFADGISCPVPLRSESFLLLTDVVPYSERLEWCHNGAGVREQQT
jgi:hypothetical protein